MQSHSPGRGRGKSASQGQSRNDCPNLYNEGRKGHTRKSLPRRPRLGGAVMGSFGELIRKAVGEKDDCISIISKTMYIPRLCSYAWTLDWSISHLCWFGM